MSLYITLHRQLLIVKTSKTLVLITEGKKNSESKNMLLEKLLLRAKRRNETQQGVNAKQYVRRRSKNVSLAEIIE